MKRLIAFAMCLAAIVSISAQSPAHSDLRSKVKFIWSADFGGSIDMSGNDMSTIDLNLAAGLRYRWIKMLAIGTGAKVMVSNSCRTFPVYAQFQTDFHQSPRILFLDMRAGLAMNYLEANTRSTGAYIFGGVGINLARSSKFCSYMTVGYNFISRPDVDVIHYDDLHFASIKLGINF